MVAMESQWLLWQSLDDKKSQLLWNLLVNNVPDKRVITIASLFSFKKLSQKPLSPEAGKF
jgi:hypothetical protein